MMKNPLLMLCTALLMASPLAGADGELQLSSGEQTTPVLELYTSQGCSSCPPAERWLSGLREHPALWRELIPLAFHVDYWDRLGWPDAFANPGYSARQRTYARGGASQAVYTPEFILAGREWRGWFLGQALRLPEGASVGRLTLHLEGDRLRLSFAATRTPPPGLIAHVARLGFGLRSTVTRGENAGRTLQHDFVVLTLQQIGASSPSQWQARLPVDHRGERQALVAWLSAPSQLAPYQAVGGWLSAP